MAKKVCYNEATMKYSEVQMELFDEALCFATERHSGQKRKTSDIPYILHPIEVATIVATMSEDEELLSAALLHDTVEDTDTTIKEIKKKFGKRVALLVMTETEDKREDQPENLTWKIRKEESLNILQNTKDKEVKMLWLGDKLANMRSFYRLYLEKGDKMWQNFNQKDPNEQAWYYFTIIECMSELKEYAAYNEFVRLVNKVFENHGGKTNDF